MSEVTITVSNFTNGLWTAGPPTKCANQFLTRAVNVTHDDYGIVKSRNGAYKLYDIASVSDGLTLSSDYYFKAAGYVYKNQTSLGFTQFGNSLVALAVAADNTTSDIVIFPICMKKEADDVVSNFGLAVTPAVITAADSGVAGYLTGAYTYRVTFFNSVTQTESAPSVASASVTVTSKKMTLTLPGTCSDSQVDKLRIYRSTGNVTDAWYWLASVAISTTSYTDNSLDAVLTVADKLDYLQMAPPPCMNVGRFSNRVILTGMPSYPRFIYYSIGGKPEVYSGLNLEMIADGKEALYGCYEEGEVAYLFGQNNIYMFQVTSTGVTFSGKYYGTGIINSRCYAQCASGCYIACYDGIYLLRSQTLTKISSSVDALFRNVDRGGLSTIADYSACKLSYVYDRLCFSYQGTDSLYHSLFYVEGVANVINSRFEHYTGWRFAIPPIQGKNPIVGLADSVGYATPNMTTDDGEVFRSLMGFRVHTHETAAMQIRHYRLKIHATGDITINFYDEGVLKYSRVFTAAELATYYEIYSLPSDVYFQECEVTIESISYFEFYAMELRSSIIRKDIGDYTRQPSALTASGIDAT